MHPLHPVAFIATWFGSGLLPKIPGTWGSITSLPFAWVIDHHLGKPGLAIATFFVFVLGVWISKIFIQRFGKEDPQAIVIDEVAGQWLVLLAVPTERFYYATGFVLFRFFDIVKPWPANWADRHIKGGLGVMLDDILVTPYAIAVLYGVMFILADV